MSKLALRAITPVESDGHSNDISTVLSTLFLFRLAGLPTDALRAIESKHLRALTAIIDQYERTMATLDVPLNAALHQLINVLAKNDLLRDDVRELIELKRAVHNARVPKRQSAIDVAKRYLEPQQTESLDLWAAAAYGLKENLARTNELLALDQEESRVAIHAWSNKPIFKRALQISNAQLEEKLDRYFVRTESQITHKHRLLDSALYGYFLRACTKTSPFSTFGIVSYGLWSDLHTAPPPHLARDISYTTKTRLNAALLARMATSIQKVKTTLGMADLKLNPTCDIRDDKVHFLRMRSRPLSRLMAFGAINSHGMFSITLTEQLQRMMNILAVSGALPMHQLILKMSEGTSSDVQEIKTWLAYLIDVSLLESSEAYDVASYSSLLEHVRRGASQIGSQVLSGFVERAEAMTEQMDTDDVVKRRTLLAGISAAVQDLASEADGMQLKLEASTIFYEDAVLSSGRHGLPLSGNAEFIDNLKLMQQLQPIYDTSAPLRAALTEYFKKRFGAGGECSDIPRFSEEFARECAGPFLNASTEAKSIELFDASFDIKQSKNIRASRVLHCLRNLSMRHVRQLGRCNASDEVTISADALVRLRAHMPTRLHSSYSGSFFVQHCMNYGPHSNWVLNKVYGGSGQLMSRLLYLWESDRDDLATRTLRNYIAENVPPNTVIAELPGNGDSNLNFHPNLVDYVIAGSGDGEASRDRTTIALRDLCIRHDVETDTLVLYSISAGHRILPVYLGGLVSELLPDVQKLLLVFGLSTANTLPAWNTIYRDKEPTSILRYPRLSIGNIVVMRKMWSIPPDLVPRRTASESEGELYLRTQKWLKANALPAHNYITFSRDPDGNNMNEANQRKPMFFDFESIRSLLSFQKELEKHDGVLWLAEALPDPSPNTPVAGQEAEHIRHHCEYIFDITSTTRH